MDQIKLRLGQAVGLKELIATLVVAGLLLIVGTVVFAKVKASMADHTLSAAANSTIANVEATTYNAFQLATVALIVLAAAVIIGILIPIRSTKILHWQNKSFRRISVSNLRSSDYYKLKQQATVVY